MALLLDLAQGEPRGLALSTWFMGVGGGSGPRASDLRRLQRGFDVLVAMRGGVAREIAWPML